VKKLDVAYRKFIKKEDGQIYAIVDSILGDCRINAFCEDGVTRVCHIRGKIKKRMWIKKDDILIICIRDFDENKADIIFRYTEKQKKKLLEIGEINIQFLEKAGKNTGISNSYTKKIDLLKKIDVESI